MDRIRKIAAVHLTCWARFPSLTLSPPPFRKHKILSLGGGERERERERASGSSPGGHGGGGGRPRPGAGPRGGTPRRREVRSRSSSRFSAWSVPRRRGSGLVPQPSFAPPFVCSRACCRRVEQLSLKRRRRGEEEAEAAVADAEVALGLESAYQVGSSRWAGVQVRGFLLVYRYCGLIVVCFICVSLVRWLRKGWCWMCWTRAQPQSQLMIWVS